MMNLREYRNHAQRLADYLPWAALIAEGVVLNKDGSFQRTARFRGPDLDSSTASELVSVTHRLNGALRRLGSGWAVFVEAQRVPVDAYPVSRFPDPVSAMVDEERRAQFVEAGAHFESAYFLTLLWMPPAEDAARAEGWLYEGRSRKGVEPWAQLRSFMDRAGQLLALMDGFVPEARWRRRYQHIREFERLLEEVASQIKKGVTYTQLLAAVFLAGVRDAFEPQFTRRREYPGEFLRRMAHLA